MDLPNLSFSSQFPVEQGTVLTIHCDRGFARQRGDLVVTCSTGRLIYTAKPLCVSYSKSYQSGLSSVALGSMTFSKNDQITDRLESTDRPSKFLLLLYVAGNRNQNVWQRFGVDFG